MVVVQKPTMSRVEVYSSVNNKVKNKTDEKKKQERERERERNKLVSQMMIIGSNWHWRIYEEYRHTTATHEGNLNRQTIE